MNSCLQAVGKGLNHFLFHSSGKMEVSRSMVIKAVAAASFFIPMVGPAIAVAILGCSFSNDFINIFSVFRRALPYQPVMAPIPAIEPQASASVVVPSIDDQIVAYIDADPTSVTYNEMGRYNVDPIIDAFHLKDIPIDRGRVLRVLNKNDNLLLKIRQPNITIRSPNELVQENNVRLAIQQHIDENKKLPLASHFHIDDFGVHPTRVAELIQEFAPQAPDDGGGQPQPAALPAALLVVVPAVDVIVVDEERVERRLSVADSLDSLDSRSVLSSSFASVSAKSEARERKQIVREGKALDREERAIEKFIKKHRRLNKKLKKADQEYEAVVGDNHSRIGLANARQEIVDELEALKKKKPVLYDQLEKGQVGV